MVRVQDEEQKTLTELSGFYYLAMYYIYIIYSTSVDKYYIGHSDNPDRRLVEHNTKPVNTYTSKHRPWVLKASFPISKDRGQAISVERYLKKLKSRKITEQLIENQDNPVKIAQSRFRMNGIEDPRKTVKSKISGFSGLVTRPYRMVHSGGEYPTCRD